MSSVRFRAGDIALELTGSESFVNRQLRLLSPFLGEVEEAALVDVAPATVADEPSGNGDTLPPPPEPPAETVAETVAEPAPVVTGDHPLNSFYASFDPGGRDRQSDAALLFAYYLQRKEGMNSLTLSDLIRCCIRAGVDTRNFNRTLGTLTRRGFLQTVRHGQAYRLSDQGVAAVESRM